MVTFIKNRLNRTGENFRGRYKALKRALSPLTVAFSQQQVGGKTQKVPSLLTVAFSLEG
jgi:hypothetical protein